jgi:MFS family permease
MSQSTPSRTARRATIALALLLAINLFNYIDRYVLAAVEPRIAAELLPGDIDATAKTGSLATAFLFSYMFLAPVFGWIADRFSRWILIGCSVALWTLASGWSGMAASFGVLLLTRIFVGVGEAGYGPSAPTIIADMYPVEKRGQMLSLFYLAIPVGSAIGYMLGGAAAEHLSWRWAFYLVVPPGLLLALFCFFMKDTRVRTSTQMAPADDNTRLPAGDPELPRPTAVQPNPKAGLATYKALFRIPSYALNTAAMTAMTFAIGGMAFWMPRYIYEYRAADFPGGPNLDRINFIFGAISAVGGLLATMLGGWLGDRLRRRYKSAYFLVSGTAILLAFPPTVAMLFVPFPYAWIFVFLAIFFLFFNTGPSNTALANVTPPTVRASAYALNIFTIHLLGDAISPPLMGWLAPRTSWNVAFLVVAAMMVVAGICWLIGTRFLAKDTDAVTAVEEAAKRQTA